MERTNKSHPGVFATGLNLCQNAGRISGGLSADWLTGGWMKADSINNSMRRLPSCKV